MNDGALANLDDALIAVGVRLHCRKLSELTDALLADGWSFEYREPCPYTHSHTRHWCGHPGCRDS